jgi:hypothetical protein
MSKYEQLQKKPPKNFKRLIGINEETLEAMISVFRAYETERKKNLVKTLKRIFNENYSKNNYIKLVIIISITSKGELWS